MNDTGTLYTTADGWTIDTDRTIAARWRTRVRLAGGEKQAAGKEGISLPELRRMLTDHRLDPAPIITPDAMAVIAMPLPVLDAPEPGQATEADLIRLCNFTVSVTLDYQRMDWVTGCTLYEPPAEFAARRDALGGLRQKAIEVIADISATTLAGIRAKGRALKVGFDIRASSLEGVDLAYSILADCGVEEWPYDGSASGDWVGEPLGTAPVSDGEPVTIPVADTARPSGLMADVASWLPWGRFRRAAAHA